MSYLCIMLNRRFIPLFFAVSLLLLAGAGAAGNYNAHQQLHVSGEAGFSTKKNPLKDPERISPVSVSVLQLSVHKKVNSIEAWSVILNGFSYTRTAAVPALGQENRHKAYLSFIYPSHHFW